MPEVAHEIKNRGGLKMDAFIWVAIIGIGILDYSLYQILTQLRETHEMLKPVAGRIIDELQDIEKAINRAS
jgi:hypothetical protein